jgi:uncharacterized protein (DUF1684 family)
VELGGARPQASRSARLDGIAEERSSHCYGLWLEPEFDDPAPHTTVVLDFNRTINMWFAFTDHATCPMPVTGNTITVPVRAGGKITPTLRNIKR